MQGDFRYNEAGAIVDLLDLPLYRDEVIVRWVQLLQFIHDARNDRL